MRADAQERRARILVEARRLILLHGPDVALESIAAASHVGIATLYRNFPAREQLLAAVAEDIVAALVSAADECRQRATNDPSAAWAAMLTRLGTLDLGALTASLTLGTDAEIPSAVTDAHQRAHAALTGALAALDGLLRPEITADALIVAVATITRPHPVMSTATARVRTDLLDAYDAWARARTVTAVTVDRH